MVRSENHFSEPLKARIRSYLHSWGFDRDLAVKPHQWKATETCAASLYAYSNQIISKDGPEVEFLNFEMISPRGWMPHLSAKSTRYWLSKSLHPSRVHSHNATFSCTAQNLLPCNWTCCHFDLVLNRMQTREIWWLTIISRHAIACKDYLKPIPGRVG